MQSWPFSRKTFSVFLPSLLFGTEIIPSRNTTEIRFDEQAS